MHDVLDVGRSPASSPAARTVRDEITRIKVEKAAWAEGGGARSSMDAFTRTRV